MRLHGRRGRRALVVVDGIWVAAAAVILLSVLAGEAQEMPAGADRTLYFDPTEVDSVTLEWDGPDGPRPLSTTLNDHTVTIAPSGPLKKPDSVPNDILIAKAVSGNELVLTFSPNAGCAQAKCRMGNTYQVRIQVTDTAGLKPVYNLLLKVQQQKLLG